MGIFPVVHGTCALALKAKISKTNTFERIARLSQMGLIDNSLAKMSQRHWLI
nr:putative nucleotidyltransferase substrate binding domain-containing protein [Moraxella catarrhalis]